MKRKSLTVIAAGIAMSLAGVLDVHAYDTVNPKIPVKGDPGAVIQITSDNGAPLPAKTNITLGKKGKGTFVFSFDEPDDYHYTITRTDKKGFSSYYSTIQVINGNQDGLETIVTVENAKGEKTFNPPEFITPKPPKSTDKPSEPDKPKPTDKTNPTGKPSDKPTKTNKPKPTGKPSHKPTKTDKPKPSVKPSDKPTKTDKPEPSENPENKPTEEPTVSPEPSHGTEVIPTVPSEAPSEEPSVKPSPEATEKTEKNDKKKNSEKASPESSDKSKEAPDTSDHFRTGEWIALFAGAVIVVAAVAVIRKKQSD